MPGFPRRRPRGPRRKDLLKQHRYWLRADEVPRAGVNVDPACASQFDRFNAFRDQHTPGLRPPVELDVLIRRDSPGKISAWTLPSEALKAMFVGYLSGVAVSAYEAVLHRLSRYEAPIAMFTAHRVGAGRYDAVVEGRQTYVLAVWEGERPTDGGAGEVYIRLYSQYIDTSAEVAPTPAIRAYAEALLDRWVDMNDDVENVSPWSDGPLINNAQGPIIYFSMRPSMADEVSAAAARMAANRGLVCFDPQWNCLRPTPDEP